MQTLGIVALSLLAGIFLAVLLAALATVIYFAKGIKSQAKIIEQRVTLLHAESNETLQSHRKQFEVIAESAKSSLTTTRQEMRSALEVHAKAVDSVLKEHQRAMDAVADKINATQLLEASKQAIVVVKQMGKVAEYFMRLRSETERGVVGEPWSEERAEEYGPESEHAPTIYSHVRPEDDAVEQEDENRLPVGL